MNYYIVDDRGRSFANIYGSLYRSDAYESTIKPLQGATYVETTKAIYIF